MRWISLALVLLFFTGCSSVPRELGIKCSDGVEQVKAQIINSNSFYPESPLWLNDRLYYVEYSKNRIMEWDGSKNSVLWEQPGCGPAAIASTSDGLLVTCYDANSIVRIKFGDSPKVVGTLAPFKGPNDFAKDERGGVYFTASGVFDLKSSIEGKVYYLNSDRKIHLVAENMHYANGIAVIHEGKTLVVSEHLKNRLIGFTITSTGKVDPSSWKILADLSSIPLEVADRSNGLLGPDGIRLGKDNILYVAQYGGSRILKFKVSESGSLDLDSRVQMTSQFPNTDNVWVTDDGKLFGTAVEETASPDYPGIVYLIETKGIKADRSLSCKIRSF